MPEEEILSSKQKVERIPQSFADYSILPTLQEFLFLQRGDYWIIRYQGHTAFLKSTRGLDCLAVLLREPGREFHVTDLLCRPVHASTPAAAALGFVTGGLYARCPGLRSCGTIWRRRNGLMIPIALPAPVPS